MEIVSVHIEELARVTGRGEGFNLWGRITFTVRDSDADVRPFRLHVEVDVPIDPAAPLLALKRALLEKAWLGCASCGGLLSDLAGGGGRGKHGCAPSGIDEGKLVL